MWFLRHIVPILIIFSLISCRTSHLQQERPLIISNRDIHYDYTAGVYFPSVFLRGRIEKYICHNFSWRRAGYVYKNGVQGESVVLLDYDASDNKIKDIRVLMSTNILSVDEELIHSVSAIRFVNAIKGDRKVIVRFLLRIKYNEFGK